ncbi:Heavy metal-associated domain containing protein [Trema orientale]|uniref:Heavy metal-associated domain containing protein n=1 Tax=Trema orientale TaxID=63057 RepID=A0A2P5EXL8_TREOI|nr:Heavy metal-associated domain containing protein [Trema orientale]
MVDKQVTIMVLKVDLQCHRCYKKIKKVLCKIPQIQDQVYDKKQNTVTIKVVCCSPEKIKQKIICEPGVFIWSIEIKAPEAPRKPEQTNRPNPDKKPGKEPEKNKPPELVPCWVGYPVPVYCPGPFRTCCNECYEGRPGGPCVYGQGVPVPPCHQYGGGSGDCVLVHYQESSYGSCLIM